MTEQTPKSIALYMTDGSSDKEYHVHLQARGGGWIVNFANGRRGRALKPGTKTTSPVSYEEADKIYSDLVKAKTKKGYTTDVSGEVFQDTVAGEQFSGLLPQLPQTVRDEQSIEQMLGDPEFVLQEKFDGDNRQIHVQEGVARGINKRGMIVPLPMNLVEQARAIGNFLACSEIIGSKLYLFDLLERDGHDLRDLPYAKRLEALNGLAGRGEDLHVVPTAFTPQDKQALVDRIRQQSGEGVVFKRVSAAFRRGKLSATQSDQFKWKFTEDCTVRVKKASKGKRSIEVEIDGTDGPLDLGKVTIPANYDIPSPGDLVSVVYLHLFEGGSLFQAQYKGVRTDCDGPDTLDMFKIKAKEPTRRLGM